MNALQRRFGILATAALMVVFVACGDDDGPGAIVDGEKPPEYENLTQRWHVLNNLELAWNERNLVEYERLLDPDVFTFYFAAADFSSGRAPEFWGRGEEVLAANRMFDPNFPGTNRLLSIDVTLDMDPLTWLDVIPDDFPDETWYAAVVPYELKVVFAPDITVQSHGTHSTSFTVRNVGDTESPQWRLVEWQDYGRQERLSSARNVTGRERPERPHPKMMYR